MKRTILATATMIVYRSAASRLICSGLRYSVSNMAISLLLSDLGVIRLATARVTSSNAQND